MNNFFTLESSRLVLCYRIVILVENMLSIASFANKVVLDKKAKGISLINSKKRSGPQMNRSGIPMFTMQCVEFTLFTVVYCLQSVK